ncbi:hypothetical protein EAH87_02600 [Sphingomonas koreensis]|nr:hypothetical protein EAH87_02600 [Sphingomonas koreensis]
MTSITQSLRDTAEKTRDRTSDAYETTRDGTRDALKRAGDALEGNALAVLAGGAAVGLLAGAVIPRTAREAKLFGNVGKRINTAASAAAVAAREAGIQELDARGISGKAARAQVGKLFDGVIEAATTAGGAAASAAADKAKKSAKAK